MTVQRVLVIAGVLLVLLGAVGGLAWCGPLSIPDADEWHDECPASPPTWTPYVQPTYTPRPTYTPEPSPTCYPTLVPEPTYTLLPTAIPYPTNTPYPTQPPWGTPIVGTDPANSNASEDTRKVLNWLVSLPQRPDKRVISGQHICCGWDLPAAYNTYITALYKETGKYPALLGAGYAYGIWCDPGQNSTLIEHWNNGGLITLSWQAYNPWTGNGLEWTGGDSGDRNIGDLADLYTPGNDAYDMWHADMDRKAEWLDELQKAGVVVLWRPFHEMNGCWTWWACRDQTKFVNLWRYMFDYFTYEKGLNNLLWVYAPALDCPATRIDAAYYYPGTGYVDIVGLDYYLTGSWDIDDVDSCGRPELLALGKPFALTEFGPTGWAVGDDPPEHEPSANSYDYGSLMDEIRAYCPEAVYFLLWWQNYAMVNQNNAQGLLDDPWVITRDEVDWK